MSFRVVVVIAVVSALLACGGGSGGGGGSFDEGRDGVDSAGPAYAPTYFMTVDRPTSHFPYTTRKESVYLWGELSLDFFQSRDTGEWTRPTVHWSNRANRESGSSKGEHSLGAPHGNSWSCLVPLAEGENTITITVRGVGATRSRTVTVVYVPLKGILLRAGGRYELVEDGTRAGWVTVEDPFNEIIDVDLDASDETSAGEGGGYWDDEFFYNNGLITRWEFVGDETSGEATLWVRDYDAPIVGTHRKIGRTFTYELQ